ncbi:MAG: hypothetical protein IKU23_06830 [Clostridia bacterium]|nr:hypothetical protein [Clostridia bacterium]MBR5278963.1 hypothetical protein [Clostridia bacterium]
MQLIVGLKGTGKTKTLIEEVNRASNETKGVVICIEYGRKLNSDITTRARLVDALEYGIDSADKLYGFVCGMFACNYDITELYIDSALKICADDVAAFEEFVVKTAKLADLYKIECIVTASCEAATLSEKVKGFIK